MKKVILSYLFVVLFVMVISFVSAAEVGDSNAQEDILSNSVSLSDFFEEISSLLFGFDNVASSNLANFMVYFSLWIILYVFIANILMFIFRLTNISILAGSWKSWAGGLFLTYIFVQYLFVKDGISFLSLYLGRFFIYLFSLVDLFDVLELTIYILFVIFITFFVSALITIVQRKIKLKRAYDLGFQIGSGRS